MAKFGFLFTKLNLIFGLRIVVINDPFAWCRQEQEPGECRSADVISARTLGFMSQQTEKVKTPSRK